LSRITRRSTGRAKSGAPVNSALGLLEERVRTIQILVVLSVAAFAMLGLAKESLYVVRSKDQGITAFDLTVTETKRESNKSFLSVPGFHKRSAAGSRWLMCAYTNLAIKRGFNYWSVIYPEEGSETLIVGFPKSQNENIVKTLGSEFSGKNVVPEKPASVEVLAKTLCGMRR
jgi:hypothetical protein